MFYCLYRWLKDSENFKLKILNKIETLKKLKKKLPCEQLRENYLKSPNDENVEKVFFVDLFDVSSVFEEER